MTRQLCTKLDAAGKTYEFIVLGEKGRSQLRRTYGEKFVSSATDRVVPYNFDLASAFAQDSLANQYDGVHLLFNKFVSAIAYTPSIKTVAAVNQDSVRKYIVEPSDDNDVLQNFYEYTLATQVYHALMENATSEQSSRMNAMENASKNAGEMIDKLTLQYNRARQARITTELIEIISGASALKN